MSSKSSSSKKSEESVSGSTKNANKNNKIFVTSIDVKTPIEDIDKQLRQLFNPFGEILKIDIKKSFNNTYSFAFVEFSDAESAAKVISSCKNCQINGKRISIDFQRSNPREKRSYPPREYNKSRPLQPEKPFKRQEKENTRNKDDGKYEDKKKERTKKYSPSVDRQKQRKKRSEYKDDFDYKKRRDDKKRSETPEYKHSKRNESRNQKDELYNERSNRKSRYVEECYNCKSTNHPTRECPQNIDLHKGRCNSSSQSSSDSRRRERSRKSIKHPQVLRRDRREKEKNRRYRGYSSDFSESSSNRSYRRHRKPSKRSRKIDRHSSSSGQRHKPRYN